MGLGEAVQDRKLFIGGLSPQTDDNALKSYYSRWGEIVDVVVMKDNSTGRSRGFGFVTFSDASMAEKAVADGPHVIDGKSTDTKRAISKDSMDERSSGPTDKVFVGGLTREISNEQLRNYFETFGSVKEATVMTDKETGESRCFAFVIFNDMDTVDKVMESKPHNLQGCQIDVQKAVTKEEMKRKMGSRFQGPPSRSTGRGGSRGYYGGGGGGGGGRYQDPYYDRGYDHWGGGYYPQDYYGGGYYDQGYYSYGGYGPSESAGGPMRGHYGHEGYDYQSYGSSGNRGGSYGSKGGASKPRGGGHAPYISLLAAEDVINNHRASVGLFNAFDHGDNVNGKDKLKKTTAKPLEDRYCRTLPGTCVRLQSVDTFSLERMSSTDPSRMEKFRNLLLSPQVDLQALRDAVWNGIPFCYRAKVWKFLMNYLPSNTSRRDQTLLEKRRQYSSYVDQYYTSSASLKQPNETISQIRKDTKRTSLVYGHESLKEMLERILYICAWRNPACSYVQGMNDLVMPFLAVFINEYVKAEISTDGHLVMNSEMDLTEEQLMNLEADTYWCFSRLLHMIQHNYINNQPGIQANVKLLKLLISRVDEPLHKCLEQNQVAYLQFSFRWMNNLLLRELPLRCVIRLWDAYMSEMDGFDKIHVYVCAAFLLQFSDKLKEESDFQGLLLLLQRLPTSQWSMSEIETLLARAYTLKVTFANAPGHISTHDIEILF
ncbi:hypothetical protein Ciccas_005897 [Cichlidogyrus casuarinus]|uniref:Rab-GAP TBC domain-containing protein n=1 Tax=Cichlidogyrus casuarinus TaxID=1844966 RepID=A0ABD2Q7C2_9PLAT